MKGRVGRNRAGAALVAVLALLGACNTEVGNEAGGETGAGEESALVQQAREVAEGYMEPVTEFPGPTEGPAAAPTKRVVAVSCGMSSDACARPVLGAEEAGKVLGWDVEVCDGDFTISEFKACIDLAVDTGADGIVLASITPEFVKAELSRARDAGIVSVSIDDVDPDPELVDIEIYGGYREQGEAIANFTIWKTNGKPNTLLQWEHSYNSVNTLNGEITKIYDEDNLNYEEFDFVEGEIADVVPQQTVAELQANPDINSLVNFDDAHIFTIPEIRAAGLQDRVLVVGYTLPGAAIELIRQGALAGSIAPPQSWEGWAAMDNLNRVFNGEEPVEQNVPLRLITQENVDEIPEGQAYEGDVDFRAAYEKIWNG